jgi:signal recognition particle GTPase
MNTTTKTEGELVEMLNKASSDIRWAEAAGRSVSTINRLWRKYFAVEDALKAFAVGW